MASTSGIRFGRLALGAALVGLGLLAAGCLYGSVTDQTTGGVIAGASVKITDSDGKSVTLTTGANGVFSTAERMALGTATYEVSAPGYETATFERQITYADNDRGHEVELFSLVRSGGPPPPPPGEGAFTMTVEAPATTSTDFDANIRIDNIATPYTAFNVAISYNPAIVNPGSQSVGAAFTAGGDFFCVSGAIPTPGLVIYACTLLNPGATTSQAGILATFRFTRVGAGSTKLHLQTYAEGGSTEGTYVVVNEAAAAGDTIDATVTVQ